jgi:hypothetical protein
LRELLGPVGVHGVGTFSGPEAPEGSDDDGTTLDADIASAKVREEERGGGGKWCRCGWSATKSCGRGFETT